MISTVGIISKKSYSLLTSKGKYKVFFSIIINKKNYIFSEINAMFISERAETFSPGEKVYIHGEIIFNPGICLKIKELTKLSNYQISL